VKIDCNAQSKAGAAFTGFDKNMIKQAVH